MTIGYLRVSTEKQNPENQKDEIRRFAEEKGWNVDTWVVETVSGKVPPKKRKLGRLPGRLACLRPDDMKEFYSVD